MPCVPLTKGQFLLALGRTVTMTLCLSPDTQVVTPTEKDVILIRQEESPDAACVASELDGHLLGLHDVQKVDLPIGGYGHQISPTVVDDSVLVLPEFQGVEGMDYRKEELVSFLGSHST